MLNLGRSCWESDREMWWGGQAEDGGREEREKGVETLTCKK